jgi:hypothetical protein
MSKAMENRPSRLFCFGGAKACTDACLCLDPTEDTIVYGFMD